MRELFMFERLSVNNKALGSLDTQIHRALGAMSSALKIEHWPRDKGLFSKVY